MATSQNGYAAGNRALIHNPAVPGTNIRFPGGLRKGPTGDLLLWVALQLHHRVENGGTGYGMWGYAYRAIRGATSLSNHASGTAIDWHAPRHPLGKTGTFNAAQVREIRRILAEAGGCVRWGGDYTGRKDEMHFEIVASEAACARALAAVTPGVPQPPATTQPVTPATKKVKPVIDREKLVKGPNYVRLPAMVGSVSGLYGRAWVSVSAHGGSTDTTILFQRDTDTDGAPAGTRGQWKPVVKNGSREWLEIPSGTEYLECWVNVRGDGGFVAVEFQPK